VHLLQVATAFDIYWVLLFLYHYHLWQLPISYHHNTTCFLLSAHSGWLALQTLHVLHQGPHVVGWSHNRIVSALLPHPQLQMGPLMLPKHFGLAGSFLMGAANGVADAAGLSTEDFLILLSRAGAVAGGLSEVRCSFQHVLAGPQWAAIKHPSLPHSATQLGDPLVPLLPLATVMAFNFKLLFGPMFCIFSMCVGSSSTRQAANSSPEVFLCLGGTHSSFVWACWIHLNFCLHLITHCCSPTCVILPFSVNFVLWQQTLKSSTSHPSDSSIFSNVVSLNSDLATCSPSSRLSFSSLSSPPSSFPGCCSPVSTSTPGCGAPTSTSVLVPSLAWTATLPTATAVCLLLTTLCVKIFAMLLLRNQICEVFDQRAILGLLCSTFNI